MKKKLLSLLMALVMVAGLAVVPTGTADAASNKGAVIPVSFKNNVTWDTQDWENNKVVIYLWGPENVTLSAGCTLSYTLYLPKSMFTKTAEDGVHEVDIGQCVNLHDENWEWIGGAKSTWGLNVRYDDNEGKVSWSCWGFEDKEADSSWASVDEKGDYYVVTVDGYPIGSQYVKWNEAAEKDEFIQIDFNKKYNTNIELCVTPTNGTGGDAVVICDDVVLKDSANEIYSQDFSGTDDCGDRFVNGDDPDGELTKVKGDTYTTSLLSLKAKKADIKVGKKAKIKATAVKGTKVTYKSNKPKVASVDAKGNVKGLKKGKAVISVSCCGKTLKYTVKVSK